MGTVSTNTRSTGFGAVARARVDLWLVVALMAMAFGAGVIVRTMAEPPVTPATSFGQTVNGGVVAPPLTDQQLGQALPAGHPTLPGSEPTTAGGGGGGNGGNNGGGGNGG